MSKLLVKTRKKERYIGKVMALHYCRYSNRVLAIKKSHWMMRLDSKTPRTSKVQMSHCSGSCWDKSVRGHKGLHYQLHHLLCLAPLPAMLLSPDICHGHTASGISTRSSRWPTEIPDVSHATPSFQISEEICQAQLTAGLTSGHMGGWVPSLPRSISNAHTPCITPDQSCGQRLVSEPTQRTDSFLNRWENNSISRNLQQITIHTECKEIVELVKTGNNTCNPQILWDYYWVMRRVREMVWSRTVFTIICCCPSPHSSQSRGRLCSVSTKTSSHKCDFSGFSIEQEKRERSVQQTLCHSSIVTLPSFCLCWWNLKLDYVLGELLLFCCPSKTPGLCPLLGKSDADCSMQHCHINSLHWDWHCHSPDLSLFMFTATQAEHDQSPKVTCLQEILASLRELKNNPRLHQLNNHG